MRLRIAALSSILLISVIFSSSLANAQTAAPTADATQCDVAGTTKQVAAFQPSGDNDKDKAALIALASAIQDMNASCNGITITSKANGVLGEVDYPAGIYITKVITRGRFVLADKWLGGDSCLPSDYYNILVESAAGAPEGDFYIGKVRQGCKIRYSVSGVTLPYTLTIVPLLQDTKITMQTPAPTPTK